MLPGGNENNCRDSWCRVRDSNRGAPEHTCSVTTTGEFRFVWTSKVHKQPHSVSPPTLIATYSNYLQPQHKTWNQLHRQLAALWCNVGMIDMTDKLITRTTGIALCSFDFQLVRRATLRTKNYLHLTEKKNQSFSVRNWSGWVKSCSLHMTASKQNITTSRRSLGVRVCYISLVTGLWNSLFLLSLILPNLSILIG